MGLGGAKSGPLSWWLNLLSVAVNDQGWGEAPFSARNSLTLSHHLGKMKAVKSECWEMYSSLLRNAGFARNLESEVLKNITKP